jgi:hypothetical protein
MLRVQTGVGYERALANLSSGHAAGGGTGGSGGSGGTAGAFREFVMRDVDGHVDKIRVDLTANPGLLQALNTTAAKVERPVTPVTGDEPSEYLEDQVAVA